VAPKNGVRDDHLLLGPGEMLVCPRGAEHKTYADSETELLIEPSGVVNTGDEPTPGLLKTGVGYSRAGAFAGFAPARGPRSEVLTKCLTKPAMAALTTSIVQVNARFQGFPITNSAQNDKSVVLFSRKLAALRLPRIPPMKPALGYTSLVAVAVLSLAGVAPARSQEAPKSTPTQLVDALNTVFGKQHPGERAVHAKGTDLEGSFTPAPSAAAISKAPHLQKTTVPVIVRFSNFAGIADIPDHSDLSSPRGLSVKFTLPDGTTSDIVAHSFNGFPSATADDFRQLLLAIGKTLGPNKDDPKALDTYFGTHPIAKTFLTSPKPDPVSYASLPYFGVNTFKFTNAAGKVTYGRYQFRPVSEQYLSADAATKTDKDYLRDEIRQRVAKGPVTLKLVLQISEPGDKLDDPSIAWSDRHRTVELGTLIITKPVADNLAAEKRLLFLPNALPAGIEPEDPMITARSQAYPVSFGRRQGP
jgi:catalase